MMGRGFEHNNIQNALNDQRRLAQDPEVFRQELKSRNWARLIGTAIGIVIFLYFFWIKKTKCLCTYCAEAFLLCGQKGWFPAEKYVILSLKKTEKQGDWLWPEFLPRKTKPSIIKPGKI